MKRKPQYYYAADGEDLKALLIRKFPGCDGLVPLDYKKALPFRSRTRAVSGPSPISRG